MVDELSKAVRDRQKKKGNLDDYIRIAQQRCELSLLQQILANRIGCESRGG
jgi:hypothetical protein